MRKIRFQSRAVAVLAAALLPLLAAAGVITYTATYDYSNLTLGTDTLGGVTYTTVHYDGLYNGGEPGMPSLPIDYIRFSVPYNATNFTVSAGLGMTVISGISHLVYPCQPSRMMNDTTPVTVTLPDTSAYYSNTLYPSHQAWVVDEGFLAGENHIVTVAVMPIAYKHSSSGRFRDEIRKTNSIYLSLSYDLANSSAVNPIIRQSDSLRNEGYELTRKLVVNGDSVEAFSPGTLMQRSDYIIEDPSISDDELFHVLDYPYLIVTTPELLHSVRRIAALRKQKGDNVKIATIDQIRNNPLFFHNETVNFNDSIFIPDSTAVDRLRQYLKHAFKFWGTKYVLLAGTQVPYWITTNIEGHGDLFYRDLNDTIDFYPELYVGRLLGKTEDQFNNYSDKLFRYELNPGCGNPSYLQSALYTATKDFSYDINYVIQQMRSICPNPTKISELIDQEHPKGCDILNSINANHYGFMCSFNHGAPSCIKVYGHDSNNKMFMLWAIDTVKVFPDYTDSFETGNGLNRMLNREYPMIYYTNSCSTIPYYKLPGYDVDINYGESFTMGKDYGGPVYIGNVTDVPIYPSYNVACGFANNIRDGYYKLSEADALSIATNIFDKDTMAVRHNFLGDPALEIWSDIPQHFSNITVSRTNNSVTVHGLDDSDTTFVGYCNNTDRSIKRIVKATSCTFNHVSPNGTIMVYKRNYFPYIAPTFIQNTDISKSQYLLAGDYTAGSHVDNILTNGEVTVKSGIEYEIEHSGKVTLGGGFKVEKGATFIVKPACYIK